MLVLNSMKLGLCSMNRTLNSIICDKLSKSWFNHVKNWFVKL